MVQANEMVLVVGARGSGRKYYMEMIAKAYRSGATHAMMKDYIDRTVIVRDYGEEIRARGSDIVFKRVTSAGTREAMKKVREALRCREH